VIKSQNENIVVLLRVYFRIRRLSARVIRSALNAWFGQVHGFWGSGAITGVFEKDGFGLRSTFDTARRVSKGFVYFLYRDCEPFKVGSGKCQSEFRDGS